MNDTKDDELQLLDAGAAAALLGISTASLKELVKVGALTPTNVSSGPGRTRYRYQRGELRRFIESRTFRVKPAGRRTQA